MWDLDNVDWWLTYTHFRGKDTDDVEFLVGSRGVGLILLPPTVIHDFCFPPRKAFKVLLDDATSFEVGGCVSGGLRMFGRFQIAH